MAEVRAVAGELEGPGQAPAINPRRPMHRRPLPWVVVGTVLALLAAALFWWDPWRSVRVSDGSEVFAENLRQVQELIHDENNLVTGSGRAWVSIALMLPIRSIDDRRNNQEDVIRHIQGAYLAQYWANHPNGENGFGSFDPLIRLLIADTGQDGQQWQDTVAQLVAKADPGSGEHLVAVTGLGLSTDATQAAANELAEHNIPMVGTVITATGLTANGFFRVAPTNADEAAAAAEYLKKTPAWQSATAEEPYRAYLIQDRAEDDTYVGDLGDQYRRVFPGDAAHTLLQAQGDFDSQKEAAGNALAGQISAICSISPRVVFFAGRSDGLRTFLRALAARTCSETPITVISGDGASNLNDRIGTIPMWADDGANLDVFYTGLASPETWQKYPRSVARDTVNRFGECAQCFAGLFSEQLNDGDAIMSHDAVLTAIIAARNVTSPSDTRPAANALINGLYQINATSPVPGASGWIYFQRAPGLPDGVPYNKAIPIMQLHPDGTATEVDLSSRSGTPPAGPEPPR